MSTGMLKHNIKSTFLSEALEGMDPLSALLHDSELIGDSKAGPTDLVSQWNDLLSNISSSFKIQSEFGTEQRNLKDKIASRINQLDNLEKLPGNEGPQMKVLITVDEFYSYMRKVKGETSELWKADQRVATLNTVLRCVMNLIHRLPALPYPLVFASVCDILDYFGDLVYNRIVSKGASGTMHDRGVTSAEAAETAKNWLNKVSQIPDLICKIYLEMSVLRVHRFAQIETRGETLNRVSLSIREVGDPVIATFLRAYLLHVVNLHFHTDAKPQWYEQIWHDTHLNISEGMVGVDKLPDYEKVQNSLVAGLELLFLGLDRGLGARFWTLATARQCVSSTQSGLAFHSFIKAMPIAYVCEMAPFLAEAILGVKGYPIHKTYALLGSKLAQAGVPKTQRRKVLSLAWKGISQSLDVGKFLMMSEAWLLYVVKHHNTKDLDVILGEVVVGVKSRLTLASRNLSASDTNALLALLSKMLHDVESFWVLLSLDNFLPFIELFPKPHARFTASKECLSKALLQKGEIPLFYLVPVLEICRFAYVSLTSVSADDDRKQVTSLICGIIKKISTHWDVDAQLDMYVDLRRDFPDLEDVLVLLVERACQLAQETANRKTTSNQKQVESFFATCTAFIFITIPSIRNPKKRLRLYILSGQTSIEAKCMGIAEASLTEAVKILALPDAVRAISESERLNEVTRLVDTLLVLPDHPDRGPLFLLSHCFNTVRQQPWTSKELQSKWLVYAYPLICGLEAFDSRLPSHFKQLYAGNVEFQKAAKDLKDSLLEDISKYFKEVENSGAKELQASFALELGGALLQPTLPSDQDSLKLFLHIVKMLVKKCGRTSEAKALVSSSKVLLSQPDCERVLEKLQALVS